MVKFLYNKDKLNTKIAIEKKIALNDFPPYKSMNVV